MDTLIQDLRFAARSLGRDLGLTLVAVVCLGLGIGANTTIFSDANALAFHPLPQVADPARLAMVQETPPSRDPRFEGASAATIRDWRSQTEVFEDLGAFDYWDLNIAALDEAERVGGSRVTPNFFRLLGARPLLGRGFLEGEDSPGNDAVAVIGYGLWQRRFGGTSAVVGSNFLLNGQPHIVIGVMPQDWVFPPGAQAWVPLALDSRTAEDRARRNLHAFARLKPKVSFSQAAAAVSAVSGRIASQYPTTNRDWGARLEPMERYFGRGPRPFMLVLLGAVGFVLLIACANVANLLLARAAGRKREIAIRMALGASRGRIVRQLVTESVLLALMGGAFGLVLSLWGIELAAASIPSEVHQYITGFGKLNINGRALAFTLALSLLTGVVFGLLPALEASRPQLQESLKEGARSATTGARRQRLRRGLVVAEVALALMLLVSAGLMIQSSRRLILADLGFRPEGVLTMKLTLPSAQYAANRAVSDFYARLVERVQRLPGVEAAGLTSLLPMSWSERRTSFIVAGESPEQPEDAPRVSLRVVSPGFFRAMGIPLIRGGVFAEEDGSDFPPVALISESAARRFWPNENAVGRRVALGIIGQLTEIVGVVGDARHNLLVSEQPQVAVYVPLAQVPARTMSLLVRTGSDPGAMAAAVKREISALDAGLGVSDVVTMPRVVASATSPQRATAQTLAVFAAIAMLLAAVGIYGVLAYSVVQRTGEIGLRMALGATGRDVLRLVVGEAAILVVAGLGLGLAGALAAARSLRALLFEVSSTDPVTYAAVAAFLAAVGLMASYLPARRATKVDPMVALRYE